MAIQIEVLPHQADFLTSTTRHTGLAGGFGCGKSVVATLKTIEHLKSNPGNAAAYYLPTYSLLNDIAIPNFKKYLNFQGIPCTIDKRFMHIKTPIGMIVLRSIDAYERIVGYEVGYSIVDEADIPNQKKMEAAMINIVARNRLSVGEGKENMLDFVSTPEGFKMMHKFFVKQANADRRLIKGRTADNPHLPGGYITSLEGMYTAKQLAAYLNGEFVNLTSGTVYHHYDRELNRSNRAIKRGDLLYIGLDFNITNMNAVIHVIDDSVTIAVDELVGLYDTAAMVAEIKERYSGHYITVYPDAAGKQRSTSGLSDIEMLKHAGLRVVVSSANPPVRDRVNAMNLAFCDAKGHRSYYVNDEHCKIYADALEQQTYSNGVPDKTSGLDHITEAGGYFIAGKRKKPMMRTYTH